MGLASARQSNLSCITNILLAVASKISRPRLGIFSAEKICLRLPRTRENVQQCTFSLFGGPRENREYALGHRSFLTRKARYPASRRRAPASDSPKSHNGYVNQMASRLSS